MVVTTVVERAKVSSTKSQMIIIRCGCLAAGSDHLAVRMVQKRLKHPVVETKQALG